MTAIHPQDPLPQDHHHHDHRLASIAGWWVLAGVIIFSAHAGIVYAALHWHKPIVASEPPAAAVMIELSPIAVAPPSQKEDVAPGPEMVQAEDPIPDAPETMDEAEPPPAPEVVEQLPDEKIPDLPPPPPMAEAVLPAPRPVVPEPPPPEKPKPEPKKERKASRRPAAPVTSAAPKSEAPTANTAAAPSMGDSASRAQIADWRGSVSGRLNRFKRYPNESRSKGEEGIAYIRFSMDRSGNVTSVSLVKSSGFPALDSEALELPRRASPFPPPPGGNATVLTAPVNFNVH